MVPDMAVWESLLLAGISDQSGPIRNMVYREVFSVGGMLSLMPRTGRSFEYDVFLSYSSADKETFMPGRAAETGWPTGVAGLMGNPAWRFNCPENPDRIGAVPEAYPMRVSI